MRICRLLAAGNRPWPPPTGAGGSRWPEASERTRNIAESKALPKICRLPGDGKWCAAPGVGANRSFRTQTRCVQANEARILQKTKYLQEYLGHWGGALPSGPCWERGGQAAIAKLLAGMRTNPLAYYDCTSINLGCGKGADFRTFEGVEPNLVSLWDTKGYNPNRPLL
jgi:hypothetical protein